MMVETSTEEVKRRKPKNDSVTHQCEQCGKSYARKSALKDHIAYSHQGLRKYECPECKKCFELSTSFKKHLISHTEFGLMYQCETCGHISKSKDNYDTHMRKHTGEKPYVCELCSARFTCQSSLICHRKMHSGEAKVMCNHCGKQISNKKNLKRHIAQKHSGRVKPENPYDKYKLKCQMCDGRFSKLSNLNRHIRNKHTDPPSDKDAQNKNAQAPGLNMPLNRTDQQIIPNNNSLPLSFHNLLFPQPGQYSLINKNSEAQENQEEYRIQTNNNQTAICNDQGNKVGDTGQLFHSNISDNHLLNNIDDDRYDEKTSIDDNKENEGSGESIYAGDFLKEDDIKDEIKEEIDSDDIMDDELDLDTDCNMNRSENEDDDEDDFKDEIKVNAVDIIKDEIIDSAIKDKEKIFERYRVKSVDHMEGKVKKKRTRLKVKPSVNACQFCGKIFQFRNSMLRHERKHSGVKYECSYCDASYTTQYHLQRHNCSAHEVNPDYMLNRILCTQCGQGFTTNQSLREHYERQHGEGVAPMLCPDCGKGFYGKSSLKRHMKFACVSGDHLKCTICAKEFERRSALVNHMRSHQDRPVFACSGCGTVFSNKRSMVNHILQSHPDLSDEYKPPDKTEICNVCDLAIPSRRQLKQHKVDYHGLKYPYKCEKCGKGYVEKDTKLIKSHDSFCDGEIKRIGPMKWDEQKQEFKDTARHTSSSQSYQKRQEERVMVSRVNLIQHRTANKTD